MDLKFHVNSELFDRLLLPGVPNNTINCGNIKKLAKLWKIRRECTNQKELHISQTTFIKDALSVGFKDEQMLEAIFILSQHYFSDVKTDNLLLALFLQLIYTHNLSLTRSSSVERLSREEWPRKFENHLAALRPKPVKLHEEEEQLKFLQYRFKDLWSILQEDKPTMNPALDHLINPSNTSQYMTFTKVISRAHIPMNQVPDFVLARLEVCRNGVLSCIKQGRRLSWPLGDNTRCLENSQPAKMAIDCQKNNQRKIIVINQINEKTLGKFSSTLDGGTVKIHRCKNSFLYLLSPLESLTITKCENTRIITGQVTNIIRVRDCRNVELVTMSPLVAMEATWESSLFVSPSNDRKSREFSDRDFTILVDGQTCGKLEVKPYNVNYKGLGLQDEKVSVWKIEPKIVIVNQTIQRSSRNEDLIHLSSEKTQPSKIPFTNINIPNLESDERKEEDISETWRQYLEQQDLTSEEKERVEGEVSKLFSRWCRIQKKSRKELNGLISLANKL